MGTNKQNDIDFQEKAKSKSIRRHTLLCRFCSMRHNYHYMSLKMQTTSFFEVDRYNPLLPLIIQCIFVEQFRFLCSRLSKVLTGNPNI